MVLEYLKKLWDKYSPFNIDANIKKALEIIKETKEEAQKCRKSIQELKSIFDLVKREYEQHKMFAIALGDTMTDMLWLKDTQGVYLYANPVIRRDLLCNEHVIGKTDVMLAAEAKAKYGDENHTFGEICVNSDKIVLETGQAQTFYEYGKVKGEDVYLEVKKFLVYNTDGSILGIGGVATNVTKYYLELIKTKEAIKNIVNNMVCTDTNDKAFCATKLKEQLTLLEKELAKYQFKKDES